MRSRLVPHPGRAGSAPHEANPPSFDLARSPDGRLLLHYDSDRPGLAPMVRGLLRGLGKRFDTPIEIEHVPPSANGESHDCFLIDVSSARGTEAA